MVRTEIVVSCDNRECIENLTFGGIIESEAIRYALETYNWEKDKGKIYCHECSGNKPVI